jgi:tRNA dimethylallyltransferase
VATVAYGAWHVEPIVGPLSFGGIRSRRSPTIRWSASRIIAEAGAAAVSATATVSMAVSCSGARTALLAESIVTTALSSEELSRCWFVVGATATGKSAVGLQLASRLNAEIIALDSMTLYRGMDIGTAKPTAVDRQQVRHHLLDLVDPCDDYSVAEYLTAAAAAVREILRQDKVPLFVGGAGMYLRSLLRGVFAGPPADLDFRKACEDEAGSASPGALHARLLTVDPVSAARLSPSDVRRVIRALEVFHITGQPLSAWQQQSPLPVEQRPTHVYWLQLPREALKERINQRLIDMLAMGWLDEVREWKSTDPPPGRTASQALGYREFAAWLDDPTAAFDDVVRDVQTRTRQFAKRQETWFRNLVECACVPVDPCGSAAHVAEELLQRASRLRTMKSS